MLASKLNILTFNAPPGTYSRINHGYEWRTEEKPWGVWRKTNSADRHVDACFDVNYKSNDIGARDSINYLTLPSNNNVAVIGDSFVEG